MYAFLFQLIAHGTSSHAQTTMEVGLITNNAARTDSTNAVKKSTTPVKTTKKLQDPFLRRNGQSPLRKIRNGQSPRKKTLLLKGPKDCN